MMRPLLPTAQTSRGPLPHTLVTDARVVGSPTVGPVPASVQACPSQCNMRPSWPTIQASFGALAHTPKSCVVGMLDDVSQVVPLKWAMLAKSAPSAFPTAHTSLGPVPL